MASSTAITGAVHSAPVKSSVTPPTQLWTRTTGGTRQYPRREIAPPTPGAQVEDVDRALDVQRGPRQVVEQADEVAPHPRGERGGRPVAVLGRGDLPGHHGPRQELLDLLALGVRDAQARGIHRLRARGRHTGMIGRREHPPGTRSAQMRRQTRRRWAVPRGLVLVLAVLALAAGCAGANRQVSPLTGLPASSGAPVLAVKVDNSPAGRPWTGVEDADVVYVEPVEGGTTRLLAVFSSRLPASVGPVRSARESDVTVLGAYGRPALAFSGSAPELAGTLAGAPLVAVTPATAADGVPPRRRPARAGQPLRRPGRPARRGRAASPHPATSASGSARPPRAARSCGTARWRSGRPSWA